MDVNKELKFLGKFPKKNLKGGWGSGSAGGGVGLVGGVRVDVNKELKFLGKFQKKKLKGGGQEGGGSGGGSG